MTRLILALFTVWMLAFTGVSPAADFRIENRVFLDDEPDMVSESTTLFATGRVYDFFGGENDEIAVYDPSHQRFILLDPARRVKTEIKSAYIDTWIEALQKKAEGHENPFVRFLAQPKFDRSFDQATGVLTMSSPSMTYRIETVPAESEEIAREYGQFADAYARLTAVTSDVPLPPYPRLAVNAALRERKELPKRLERTVERTGLGPLPNKSVTIRSEHVIAWRLVDSDRRRIDQAADYLASFKEVPLQAYRSSPEATTAQK
jgi:hypothetical protein